MITSRIPIPPTLLLLVVFSCVLLAACGQPPGEEVAPAPEPAEPTAAAVTEGFATSADGVPIAYSATGAGEPALVFIHGGFCDGSWWASQVAALQDRYRVVTLDVAGHGASGTERQAWTLGAFASDVEAVIEELALPRVILVGHSMGGPVALEVAARMPERVVGIVAVDTLQNSEARPTAEQWQARVDALRDDFPAACVSMTAEMLPADADPQVVERVERQVCGFDSERAATIVEGFGGYDMAAAMEAVEVPIRAVNGDLYPTDVEANRRHAPDFEAVILEGVGHFPMLERTEEFNRHLAAAVEDLVRSSVAPPAG